MSSLIKATTTDLGKTFQTFGLDENKLTFYHTCRIKHLSQFGGQTIKELIA